MEFVDTLESAKVKLRPYQSACIAEWPLCLGQLVNHARRASLLEIILQPLKWNL